MLRETQHEEGSSTIPHREYPIKPYGVTSIEERGSTLTSEEVNDIVSALTKVREWSPIDTEKPVSEWQSEMNRTLD